MQKTISQEIQGAHPRKKQAAGKLGNLLGVSIGQKLQYNVEKEWGFAIFSDPN